MRLVVVVAIGNGQRDVPEEAVAGSVHRRKVQVVVLFPLERSVGKREGKPLAAALAPERQKRARRGLAAIPQWRFGLVFSEKHTVERSALIDGPSVILVDLVPNAHPAAQW
jgi:hypothetical protein